MLTVADRNVDLVLLDWMMPHLSGIEVCRQLRRKPATRNIPIVILTARGGGGQDPGPRRLRRHAHGGRPYPPASQGAQ